MSPEDQLKLERWLIHEIATCVDIPEIILDQEELIKEGVIYGSTPTTTGPRLHEVCEEHGVRSVDGLNKKDPNIFIEQVWVPNVEDGKDFVGELKRKGPERGYKYAINASKLHVNGWKGKHYMSFFEQVIRKPYVKGICFNTDKGYEYSDGCVQEFLLGLRMEKELRNRGYSLMRPDEEAERIWAAIEDLDRRGFNPEKLTDFHREIRLYLPKSFYFSQSKSPF